jgi:hypothetical protein
MSRGWLQLFGIAMSATASTAAADTFILKDGSFVDGSVTLQTSRTVHVDTRYGVRTLLRSDIERVIADAESLSSARFSQLPQAVRIVLNAEADYDLGRYERARDRLKALSPEELSSSARLRYDWLVIEIQERLGHWQQVRTMLERQTAGGNPGAQIRAQAHLDILNANENYDLRYVGEKHARNFIQSASLMSLAKHPGSLRDREIMRIALEEYCEQLLVEDDLSVKRFAEKLDVQAIYDAVKNTPHTGHIAKHLPYMNDLQRAETTLAKTQAILGDYGSAFEMDLVRTELHHLLPVMQELFRDAIELSPERLTPSFDRRTGELTKDGQMQWRKRCDEFLEAADPFARLVDYMTERVNHYPRALRDLRNMLMDNQRRGDAMIKAVKKARSRTRV